MMDVFKHSLYREALRLRLMQNSLLISQQDILLSKLCSGLGCACVLRGGLSTVKGIWLFYPKHELRQWSINYTRVKKKKKSSFIAGMHAVLCYKGSGCFHMMFCWHDKF